MYKEFWKEQVYCLQKQVYKFGVPWTSYHSWPPDKQSNARRVYLKIFERSPWNGAGYPQSIVLEEAFGGKQIDNKQMDKYGKVIQKYRALIKEVMRDLAVDINVKTESHLRLTFDDSAVERLKEREREISKTQLKEIRKLKEVNEEQAAIIHDYEKKLRKRRVPEIGFTVAGLAGIVSAAVALPEGSSFVDYAISFIAVGLHAYLAYQLIALISAEHRRRRRGGLNEGQYRFVKEYLLPGARIDTERGKMLTPGGRWKDIPTTEAARKQAETTQPHPADKHYN